MIEPFPSHIDRRDFGNWLSGFVDGEGCFHLGSYRARSSDKSNPIVYTNHRSKFVINLRADDFEALSLAQRFWGCGSLYENSHPPSRTKRTNAGTLFSVDRWQELLNIVIPHFEEFPLRAKKANDFAIWAEGTRLIAEVMNRPRRGRGPGQVGSASRWTESEKKHFIYLRDKLRGQRKFTNKMVPEMPARLCPTEEQKTLF